MEIRIFCKNNWLTNKKIYQIINDVLLTNEKVNVNNYNMYQKLFNLFNKSEHGMTNRKPKSTNS